MTGGYANPLTLGQIEADLFVAEALIEKVKTLPGRRGKFFRGQAAYHLQQAAEKLIKIQIYASGLGINHSKIYKHSLDDLITYGQSLGAVLMILEYVKRKKYIMTRWEVEGRYDIHFVVRLDTLERCLAELKNWYIILKKKGIK